MYKHIIVLTLSDNSVLIYDYIFIFRYWKKYTNFGEKNPGKFNEIKPVFVYNLAYATLLQRILSIQTEFDKKVSCSGSLHFFKKFHQLYLMFERIKLLKILLKLFQNLNNHSNMIQQKLWIG